MKNNNQELIHSIIRYNNSQNKVEASDFRSTDKIQKRLKEEFKEITNAEYEGGRRGGAADRIKRRLNLLPSYTVGQALACFQGDPVTAYNKKKEIWENDKLYSNIFNESVKAPYLVFAYSLYKAVENKKKYLVDKSKGKANLSELEVQLLDYFRNRGSIVLLTSAIAACVSIFLSRNAQNIQRFSFGHISPKEAEKVWIDVLNKVSPFCKQLTSTLNDGINNSKKVEEAISQFKSFVQVVLQTNPNMYDDFKNKIKLI